MSITFKRFKILLNGALPEPNFDQDQIALKIVLPEKLSCIAVDPRGDFCAGGTGQGRIYLWEASGRFQLRQKHNIHT